MNTHLSFACDYMEGTHPAILQKLVETNLEKTGGYGLDPYCDAAKEKIKAACGCPEGEVFFLVGGTQTNATVIDALLKSYQGVIAAEIGHVSVHEAGAIEADGHKVLTLPHDNGKISADQVRGLLDGFYNDANHDHMVMPGMVYISHPTEYGTLYTLEELTELSNVCHENHIPLYMDGARLAYALACSENQLTLADIARLCDIFYIGGTKCGALFGEALVITNSGLARKFRTYMKQNGAVLAKGWLLGLQFCALLEDDTYEKMMARADAYAMEIKAAFKEKGIQEFVDSYTNQQFVIVTDEQAEKLAKEYTFEQERTLDDGRRVVRFCTSWATTEAEKNQLIGDIRKL